jgi:hypothetical protein
MKKITSLMLILISISAHGSFPEFFGSSILNTGLGGQGSYSQNNAGNNYYHPAVLAWSKDINISTAISMVTHNFNDITNVVIKNPINTSPSTTEFGTVATDYESVQIASINVTLPVKTYGTFALSVFLPVGSIMETNSGDAYLPEYVLYRARYKRLMSHMNYAFKIFDDITMSVGAHMGFQAGANIHTNTSLNGTSYGSSATAKTQADPTISGILSTAYRLDDHQFTATFQQELKNNLQSVATGLTAIPPTAFDITIESMIYYDPHILRIGYQSKWSFGELDVSAEYQIWDSYKTPIVRIVRNSGVILASDDYESVTVSNILVPKAGVTLEFMDDLKMSFGVKYKPSIFSHDYSGAGNSLDLASYTFSSGVGYNINLFGTPMEIGGAVQHQLLQEEKITKTANIEDGSAGSKIASPGYTAGGSVTVFSFGVNVKL